MEGVVFGAGKGTLVCYRDDVYYIEKLISICMNVKLLYSFIVSIEKE